MKERSVFKMDMCLVKAVLKYVITTFGVQFVMTMTLGVVRKLELLAGNWAIQLEVYLILFFYCDLASH
jgi:hypothetical protein